MTYEHKLGYKKINQWVLEKLCFVPCHISKGVYASFYATGSAVGALIHPLVRRMSELTISGWWSDVKLTSGEMVL